MSKMIQKKYITCLIAFSLLILGSTVFADDNGFGIQALITPKPKTNNQMAANNDGNTNTADNMNNASGNANQQQAVINALLKQAQAKANANGGANNNNVAANGNSSAVTNAGLSDEAFANTIRNMMPLSPEQIRVLRQLFDDSQRAAATYPGVPPKPTSTSVIVNLSPGATPPIVRLSAGFVTSLVFVDSTGAPWPIQAFDLGDPQSFNIEWDQKGNTLLVQALRHYNSGNLAVMLKGLNTPVMLTLMPGQDAVDYRVDLRVPGLGPNANPDLDGLPSAGSPQLLDVLNGVPPAGSKPLKIDGGECQGWLGNDGHVYLRTTLTVLSPGWISTMSSADGTHAYELQVTPVVLASQRGKLVKLTIEGL